jgi:hypothetical protein
MGVPTCSLKARMLNRELRGDGTMDLPGEAADAGAADDDEHSETASAQFLECVRRQRQ